MKKIVIGIGTLCLLVGIFFFLKEFVSIFSKETLYSKTLATDRENVFENIEIQKPGRLSAVLEFNIRSYEYDRSYACAENSYSYKLNFKFFKNSAIKDDKSLIVSSDQDDSTGVRYFDTCQYSSTNGFVERSFELPVFGLHSNDLKESGFELFVSKHKNYKSEILVNFLLKGGDVNIKMKNIIIGTVSNFIGIVLIIIGLKAKF